MTPLHERLPRAKGPPISWFGPDVYRAFLEHRAASTRCDGESCGDCGGPLPRRGGGGKVTCPFCHWSPLDRTDAERATRRARWNKEAARRAKERKRARRREAVGA